MRIEVKDTAQVSEQQIRQLVDLFYDKVRADPQLGPIFGPNFEPNFDR